MKTVILAGGFGTRISEESHLKPKPLIEIGGRPILWHIMKTYSYFGYNDFIICLGYKGYHIKEYFEHYFLHESDVTFNFGMQSKRVIHQHSAEPWSVTLVNTGIDTMTGGRVKRIQKYIGDNAFMLTYGDGVADVNIKDLVSFHQSNGKLATVTAIQPSGRFGSLSLSPSNQVLGFEEKPKGDGAWINGGFFVLEPGVFEYLDDDKSVFEESPLENLALNGELAAFKHQKFWQPMDSMRDKNKLNEMWDAGKAPWKVW